MKGSCCSFRNSPSGFPDLGFGEAIERDGNWNGELGGNIRRCGY